MAQSQVRLFLVAPTDRQIHLRLPDRKSLCDFDHAKQIVKTDLLDTESRASCLGAGNNRGPDEGVAGPLTRTVTVPLGAVRQMLVQYLILRSRRILIQSKVSLCVLTGRRRGAAPVQFHFLERAGVLLVTMSALRALTGLKSDIVAVRNVPSAEVGGPYSITSSARPSSIAGMSRPSDLAVLRLMTISNLVGSWTGRSAGLPPLRIRSI